MNEDNIEFANGFSAGTEHRKRKDMATTARERMLPCPRQSNRGYKGSRFNAVRHGVLSAHTVLPWEDKDEYAALLGGLVEEHAPHGPTEEHLIEEIAGVIWRKRRLRLAEVASYTRGLGKAIEPCSDTLATALIPVQCKGSDKPIIDAVTVTPSATAVDLAELKGRQASARSALEILSGAEPGAYEAALAELDEQTRISWQEQLAPELEDPDENEDRGEDEYPDEDEEPYTADAAGLAEYLEHSVLARCAEQLGYVENRSVIRAQALGEALDLDRLEPLGRYEIQLDRKLERMLAILVHLQSLRRSNESD
jgi:hypothetical protein